MYGAQLVAYTLMLIGPPGVAGDPKAVSEPGRLLLLIISLVAALTLGLILGRWIYQPSSGDPDAGD